MITIMRYHYQLQQLAYYPNNLVTVSVALRPCCRPPQLCHKCVACLACFDACGSNQNNAILNSGADDSMSSAQAGRGQCYSSCAGNDAEFEAGSAFTNLAVASKIATRNISHRVLSDIRHEEKQDEKIIRFHALICGICPTAVTCSGLSMVVMRSCV